MTEEKRPCSCSENEAVCSTVGMVSRGLSIDYLQKILEHAAAAIIVFKFNLSKF